MEYSRTFEERRNEHAERGCTRYVSHFFMLTILE